MRAQTKAQGYSDTCRLLQEPPSSILQEDALNSEMVASLGVGRKSLKELDSDRGAETYDYSLAAEVKAKEEAIATVWAG